MSLTPSDPTPRSAVRASDADRQRVMEMLREHCTEGRLTLDEFSDRLEHVYAARTWGDLDALLSDLHLPVPVQHATVAVPDTRRRKARRWVVGVMSQGVTKGRWRTADRTTAVAFMGHSLIDLRNAEFEGPEVKIGAFAWMGGVDIIVPEGIEVIVSGFPFMGSIDEKVVDVPRIPGTPIVRVKAFAFMGGITVKSRKSEEEERQLRNERRQNRRELHEARRAERPGRPRRPGRPGAPPLPPIPGHRRLRRVLDELAEAIPTELPELRARAAPDGTVTVMFCDVENSTEMNERLSDERWWELLQTYRTIIRGQVAAHGGFEVKSAGDGFMIAFSSARRGLLCAVAAQRAVAAFNEEHPSSPLQVRIGLHTGEAIKEADDYFGRNVTMAARIAGLADGGQILTSSVVRALAEGSADLSFGSEREVELKGFAGEHRLFEVEWRDGREVLDGEAPAL